MEWVENTVVSPHHVDINNIASASAVLRYMQDAAFAQMSSFPPTLNELRANNKVFLISKVGYSIYSPLYSCEKIQAKSWMCDSKGYSFYRCGQVIRDGEIVAELVAIWALVDTNNKKLLKVTEYEQSFENDRMLDLDSPAKMRIPKEAELTLVGEHVVSYSDSDINLHINNTNYPDILCGFLPSMKNKRAIKVTINYLHEAPLGDNIKIYASKEDEDGTVYFRTVRPDGEINVEAEIIFEDFRTK